MLSNSPKWRKVVIGAVAAALAVSAVTYTGSSTSAYADVQVTTESKTAADGKPYWVQNHLVTKDLAAARTAAGGTPKKWLLVWAGDENIADTLVKDIKNLPGSLGGGLNKLKNALPGPDFLAVIDATQGSPTYGKVVNTATVGPLVENEPHHMQYVWFPGQPVWAARSDNRSRNSTRLGCPQLRLRETRITCQVLPLTGNATAPARQPLA